MTVTLRERNRLVAMAEVRRVAFELMTARGFDAVTVEQIAGEANVSPSTVYRYFGTKEALVLSAQRPSQLAERLAADTSERTPLEAFAKAAAKIWGTDDNVPVEFGLVLSNRSLLEAWERQVVDQRDAVAEALATRRSATEPGVRDQAQAAAAIAVLVITIPAWITAGGGRKPLEKALNKAFATLT